MKKLVLSVLFGVLFFTGFSAHIKGGFITYKYLGTANNGNLRYRLTLTVYMVCNPTDGQKTNPINLSIFSGNGPALFDNPSASIVNEYNLGKAYDEPCITGDQRGCYYTIVVYQLDNYELPPNADGYTITYQRCCRIANMDNLINSAEVGNTYTIKIPGTSSPIPDANKNSSPDFSVNDTAVICGGSFFSVSLAATDVDGDSLSYSLCSAYQGGSVNTPTPNPAGSPGSYTEVSYSIPYSGSSPMGSQVKINSKTGLLSGIAPLISFTGEFVVTVCVSEYRGGRLLGESRKELHIRVRDCVPLKALLDPKPVTCDGFNVTFTNAIDNPSGTLYEWNFGDTISGTANTSTLATPSHTYTDTGVYTVKLKVSISGLCADSTTTLVKVYPGFFPKFEMLPPFCRNTPIRFNDLTTTNYGQVTGWKWQFGNTASPQDSSLLRNATYSYQNAGVYDVNLIVGNTFGCVDTISQQLSIAENPALTVNTLDTTYCSLDTLDISATGTGTFSWLPATNIIGANTNAPKVYPSVATTYIVQLNSNGCTSTDSVRVNPVNNVTNSITASATNVCEGDVITLTGNSNYSSNVSWRWAPLGTIATPNQKTTLATIAANTLQYTLVTTWGNNCTATATQLLTVKPLAVPNAGRDTFICKAQGSVQLQAAGGISYQWTPATGLSNPAIANPIATPLATTNYVVAVGVAGCTATRNDTVTVTVRDPSPINLSGDTLICSIDTLQLRTNATGSFTWSPNYNISNLASPTPLVSPDVPTTYKVSLTDRFGCISTDSVFVDVKLFVTIDAGRDTTICRTDAVTFNTISDALTYQWSPANTLNDASAKYPVATPAADITTYYVVGNIGKCQSRDSVKIRTVPYPVANAGADARVCYKETVQLSASGGSRYSWSPAVFLSSSSVANPFVNSPTASTTYTVTVTDVLGCPKPVTDEVVVTVRQPVLPSVGFSDTSIVLGETIQLTVTGVEGAANYQWTPALGLSNATIANPLASPEDSTQYRLLVTTTPEGCTGRDTVTIRVYKVAPSFYVPTAFTPNNDGLNDDLKPIILGMRSIRYFRVYNRMGQLLFSTSERNKGWDGTFKGMPQDPAAYVWMAEGVTYKGDVIVRKGTALLIR
ncbi:MAG: hypothetical protein RL172_735 [Bacteroidota bacterium]